LKEEFATHLVTHFDDGYITFHARKFLGKAAAGLETRPYVTQTQATLYLHTHRTTLARMADSGEVQAVRRPQGRGGRSLLLFERDRLEAIRREREDMAPLSEIASQILGIQRNSAWRLVAEGLLHPVRGPGIDGYRFDLFRRSEASALADALISRSQRLDATTVTPEFVIPLCHAFQHVACGGGTAQIVRLVLNGKLPVFDTGADLPVMQRLVVRREEAATVRSQIARHRAEEGWLTLGEVAMSLGVRKKEVMEWTALGLLSQVRHPTSAVCTNQFYHRDDVERLRRDYVGGAEAAAILQARLPEGLAKYRRRGVVAQADELMWRRQALYVRAEVEALAAGLSDDYNFYKKASRRIGLTRNGLAQFGKRGGMRSIRAPLTRRRRSRIQQFRQDVKRLARTSLVDEQHGIGRLLGATQVLVPASTAMKRLSVSEGTLRRWVAKEGIKQVQVPWRGGYRNLYDEADIERLAEVRRQQGRTKEYPPPPDGYLSAGQAAEIVGVSRFTLRKWVRAGTLSSVRARWGWGWIGDWFSPDEVARVASDARAHRRKASAGH
jgi:DNA-binding transcriptional MerR regulator